VVATHARPDFTGRWKMNLKRSVLRGQAPKQILVNIEHREPHLRQEIHVTDAGGAERHITFAYETGAETANSVGDAVARTQARWEGEELVIESRMKTPGRELHLKDHWSLSRDGKTLTMAHRDDDLAGQISILENVSCSHA